MNAAQPTAGPWDVRRTDYHADRQCQSSGGLRDFRSSRPLFHAKYVAGKLTTSTTADMDLGTAAHYLVFEPHKFKDEIAVIPEDTERRSNAGKAAWAAFQFKNSGKVLLTEEQVAKCRRMADAVRSDPLARRALEMPGSKGEYAIRWRDEHSGLWVRNLLDFYAPAAGFIMDLKTTNDASPAAFARKIDDFRYDMQAALYKRGALEALGFDGEWMFIAVEKDEPHEVCCSILGDRSLALARKVNQSLLNELADCFARNDFSSRYAGQIQTIEIPTYSLLQQEKDYE